MMKSNKVVELEDLLKLKRAEMPNEDFWQSFNDGLNNRMINEVVGKKRVSFVDVISYLWKKSLVLAPASFACVAFAFTVYTSLNMETSSTLSIASRFVAVNNSAKVEMTSGLLKTTSESSIKCATTTIFANSAIANNAENCGKMLAL